jgi:glutamyl-tRNA synthetase
MRYFVVRKKDGYPAYQLTSVLDDIYFGADLIVRGQDLWASTLAQHYLSINMNAGTFRDITFFHHPLLMASGDKKLSKSAGDTSINYLRSQGKKPADIYSAIAGMLGSYEPVKTWGELAELIMPL